MKTLDNFIIQGLLKRLLSEKHIKPLFRDYLHFVLESRKIIESDTLSFSAILEHLSEKRFGNIRTHLTRLIAQNEELYPHQSTILEIESWPTAQLYFLRDVFDDRRFN